jgi:hypothetical protein|tara:strand:- start:9660 stop:10190 length:531 start_codon:yes stop_codon:yes gene_type:complete
MRRKSVRFFAWKQLFKLFIIVVFLAQTVCGCVTDRDSVNEGTLSLGLPGVGSVDSIRLFTSPSVLSFDNNPGADGFTAKIYAIDQDKPKPIKVNAGEIEFMVFESTIESEPLQVWKFDTKKLKRHMATTQIGVVYDFRLIWDSTKAPKRKAAILAQYRSVDGKVIKAVPVVLPIAP